MKIKNGFIQLFCLISLAICLSLLLLYITNPFIDFTQKLAQELLQSEKKYSVWASQF